MRSSTPPPRRLQQLAPRVLLIAIAAVLLLGGARAVDVLALTRTSADAAHAPVGAPAAVLPSAAPPVRPLGTRHTTDVLLTAPATLPNQVLTAVRDLPGVTATEPFRYGTVSLTPGSLPPAHVPTYGVDPSTFRNWAVSPTAQTDGFWASLAAGEASASFRAASDLGLQLGSRVPIDGTPMRLGSFASVGLPDADAVLADDRAAALGLPSASGLLISAPDADMRALVSALSAATTGTGAAVRPLRAVPAPELSTTPADPSASGTTAPAAPSGGSGELTTTPLTSVPVAPSSGGTSSAASGSVDALIAAAKSRIGAPYVYGATGPDAFDCSGFTAWAYGQIGVALPRTAQEQWQSAGTQISYSAARPGDLLAWAGDPSTPGYVTHVAIYLGDGQMIAAPHSGSTVGVQPVYSSGVLGAVRVLR